MLRERHWMNPKTGNVAWESSWKKEIESRGGIAAGYFAYEDAGLVEVEPDGNGGWRELPDWTDDDD